MIKIKNLYKYYGTQLVLKNINLEIKKGEFISIMGSSGSGKSTFLNLIGGMDLPDKGEIIVNDETITKLNDEKLTKYRRKKIGFIFQFFNLLPNLTVFENVQMPLLLNGGVDTQKVEKLIEKVGLKGKENYYPHQISGGQQQRVAIARALIHNPEIILADEPTGSLDSKTGESIMELISQIAEETKKTVILVTHEDNIAKYSQKIIKMKDGELVY
jgi:putative ABC transport system ATP-binding protein